MVEDQRDIDTDVHFPEAVSYTHLNAVAASGGVYYSKWIFGNDNLVGITGMAGMLATVVGFILSKPIIARLGIKRTICVGLLGAALLAGVRCFVQMCIRDSRYTGITGPLAEIQKHHVLKLVDLFDGPDLFTFLNIIIHELVGLLNIHAARDRTHHTCFYCGTDKNIFGMTQR